MVAMIEAVFEFLVLVSFFTINDSGDVAEILSRRFFAENMEPVLEPGDGGFRGQIIGQGDKKNIEVMG